MENNYDLDKLVHAYKIKSIETFLELSEKRRKLSWWSKLFKTKGLYEQMSDNYLKYKQLINARIKHLKTKEETNGKS
ncbi:MAG: hypothetical protein ABIH09_00660 [Candidatus Omnitrophota bacterium]